MSVQRKRKEQSEQRSRKDHSGSRWENMVQVGGRGKKRVEELAELLLEIGEFNVHTRL